MSEPTGHGLVTETDPGGGTGWRITDAVVQLRERGTNCAYEIPVGVVDEPIIGSSSGCTIYIPDQQRWISRRHAKLVRDGHLLSIHDLASKNGTWVDGTRALAFQITPGTEVRIGGLSLIAESQELVALRGLLSRIVGWGADRRLDVDQALRSLRDAATLRASLVLCGDGDLVPIAARLHRETLGADRAFVVIDRDDSALSAMSDAANGTLCMSAKHFPRDITDAIAESRTPGSRVRMVVCSSDIKAAGTASALLGRVARIEITPLGARTHELPDIIAECAGEAAASFGQPATGLDKRDVVHLRAQEFDGFADLERSTWRLVAIRTLGVTEGAARLGITHGALSRWARRRAIAT